MREPSAETRRGIARRVVQVLGFNVVTGAILFGAAGTLSWVRAWIHIGLFTALFLANAAVVLPRNPELAARRSRRQAGTKAFDKVFIALYLPSVLALPLVAGLDAVRFAWAPLPFWTVVPGALLLIVGMIPIGWSMITNPHLEPTVRIQDDRGHTVVNTGPYRYVRHPFYVGVIVMYASFPLVLGSAWAFAVVGWIALLFVSRTALEDRTLIRELEGYEAYSRRTRFRLVPHVW